MPSPINREVLEHLATLARIELKPQEEEKLLQDLQKILDYFEELKKLDTANVMPTTGGTSLKNVFREDNERENTSQGAGADQFPAEQDRFLKVPPVFE